MEVTEAHPTADELARAFAVFNEATASLQVSHEALAARVAALQAELAEKNRQLARKDRLALLGEMAAGVAHEIRNPLGSIQLYAGLLRREVAGAPSQEGLVDKLLAGARRLNRTVEDLLAYTRQMPVERTACQLPRLVAEALADAAGEIDGRPIEVVTDFPAGGLEAVVDPHQMGRVVLNLLLNAVQAVGQKGGRIEVAGARGPEGLTLVVRDDGCGIPAADRERIFDPFFTSKPRGTGLGLALVHRIVEEHGAAIEVESAEGRGTTVRIVLPEEQDGR